MPQQIIAKSAAVAAGHPHGAAAGRELLHNGGNAIDAAVAAMLALCVVIPGSVGLAGYGGSAVVHLRRRRQTVAIDFDSRAPLAFREELVTADRDSSYYGPRAVTVPAVVAGLDLLLREFGTRSWREVSQPAIRLAEHGFEFDSEHQRHYDRCSQNFDRQSHATLFAGQTPRIGYLWKQPDMAALLGRLADDGPQSFYQGQIPQRICSYLNERGGILTEEDFHSCRPVVVQPLQAHIRGYDFYTPPPPSGGITSLATVQTLEQWRAAKGQGVGPEGFGSQQSEYYHVLAEAMKLCWQERHELLGDPDFVRIPSDQLLSNVSAKARAEIIGDVAAPSPRPPAPSLDSPHTANVIAADADGNLVSLTATQGWMYGSHLVVDGLGLVLNHGMSRFDYSPDHPNAPAPAKRMQHNMAPMIVLHHESPSPVPGGAYEKSPSPLRGGAAFALGMPGGPKIVSVTAQLALHVIVFDQSPAESIAAPRLHTDGGEPLLVSPHMPAAVVANLEQRGHAVRREDDMGGPVNVLAIDQETKTIDIASGEVTGAVAGI
jgi:gamma-glutamyltranspeptidase/glutathione hydrolase